MEDVSHLPYRPGVGIMLLNAHGQVFVGQRIDNTAEAWQMPQGGIDPGEEPLPAALRELEEETGVKPQAVSLLGESRDWLRYDLPADLVPRIWGGHYRGQEQKWFALQLQGGDEHIDIATEHPEFRAWKWASADELPEIIVPFKRALYQKLMVEFRSLLRP